MNKNELKSKMQSGFLEAAPDIYESVLRAAETNRQTLADAQFHKAWEDADGSEVDFCESRGKSKKSGVRKNFSKYALSACAGFALFFVCLFAMTGKNKDDFYVVLDINPSVQIIVDELCKVEKLRGLNEDGKDLIEELAWKKKDPLPGVVNALIESAAQEDYLQEDGAILVTISDADRDMYDNLEAEIGSSIDGKLRQIGMCGVVTAFQRADTETGKTGKELLEKEAAAKCGIEEETLHRMSVVELIRYCREHDAVQLGYSPVSEKLWQDAAEESSVQEKPAPDETEEKSSGDKLAADSENKKDRADKQSGQNKSDKTDKNKGGQDSPLKGTGQNQTGENKEQPAEDMESSTQSGPGSSGQNEDGSEKDSDTKNKSGKKDKNNKKDKSDKKNGKDKNGKEDKNNKKDKENKKDKNDKKDKKDKKDKDDKKDKKDKKENNGKKEENSGKSNNGNNAGNNDGNNGNKGGNGKKNADKENNKSENHSGDDKGE